MHGTNAPTKSSINPEMQYEQRLSIPTVGVSPPKSSYASSGDVSRWLGTEVKHVAANAATLVSYTSVDLVAVAAASAASPPFSAGILASVEPQ